MHLETTHALVPQVLRTDEVLHLRNLCRNHMARPGSIPSFITLAHRGTPVLQTLKEAVETYLGEPVYYLNDFYFYSDGDVGGAPWHIDSELYAFETCINAWLLLSPERVAEPLAFVEGINDRGDNYYHDVRTRGDVCTFYNLHNMRCQQVCAETIEQTRIIAPSVSAGDLLLVNPKRFHRTNTTVPKHSFLVKFALRRDEGWLSQTPIPPMFWAEAASYTRLLHESNDWEDFLARVSARLETVEGKREFASGTYPEKLELYRQMAATL